MGPVQALHGYTNKTTEDNPSLVDRGLDKQTAVHKGNPPSEGGQAACSEHGKMLWPFDQGDKKWLQKYHGTSFL